MLVSAIEPQTSHHYIRARTPCALRLPVRDARRTGRGSVVRPLPRVICLTGGGAAAATLLAQSAHPLPSPLCSQVPSPFLPYKHARQFQFSRSHVYALGCDVL